MIAVYIDCTMRKSNDEILFEIQNKSAAESELPFAVPSLPGDLMLAYQAKSEQALVQLFRFL